MMPTLDNGNIVAVMKNKDFADADMIAFYYNNQILVKRAVAHSGDLVDIDEAGVARLQTILTENKELAEHKGMVLLCSRARRN